MVTAAGAEGKDIKNRCKKSCKIKRVVYNLTFAVKLKLKATGPIYIGASVAF